MKLTLSLPGALVSRTILTGCFLAAISVHGQSLTLITPNATPTSLGPAISSDGGVVAGYSWRWQNGTLATFPLSPDGQWFFPVGISADGSAIAGLGNDPDAYVFQSGTYYTLPAPVGAQSGGPAGISADGHTVVGSYWGGAWGATRPIRWVDASPSFLPYVGQGGALAVSGNGSVIVGWNQWPNGYLPAVWADGGITPLPVLNDGMPDGRALAVSGDGLAIAGWSATGDAFFGIANAQQEAVLWQDGGIQPLGFGPGGGGSQALGVSNGGRRAVGVFWVGCCSAAYRRAFLWSSEDGVMRYLGDVLGTLGVDTNLWQFFQADAITPDGRFIVGRGQYSANSSSVFLVDLGPVQPANHPPVARCQNVTVPAGATCMADASVDNGSSDSDAGDSITLSQSPAGPYPLGQTAVTLTVTDSHGASDSCVATVTVVDTTPPSITCPGDISIGCSVDLLVPVTFSATASDTCDPAPTITYSPASGSGFPIGTTVVTCTATDASGNHSSCSFNVNRAPLDFTGFLAPLSGSDAAGGSFANPLRTFKLGSMIAIKFTASCDGAPVLTGVHRLQVIKYSDANTAGAPIEPQSPGSANTADQFRLSDTQWVFNLDTKATGMTTGIWLVRATLSDGSQHSAWIQLK